MSLDRYYLDYNSTSPLSKSVQSWLKSGEIFFANPSSQHSRGKDSRKIINQSRELIFQTFNLSTQSFDLFFHSGATEAMSSVVHSFVEMSRLKGCNLLLCSSVIDHPCVTSQAERFWGSHVKSLPLHVRSDLSLDLEKNIQMIKDKKENDPDLIVLYHHLWVHNETGFISPLEDLRELSQINDLYIHVDAVQAPGKISHWQKLDFGDIWTFSAHKFGALKGIGFSILKKHLPFYPLISGGGQQQNKRSGTENPMGVKSIVLALADLQKISVEKNKIKKTEFEQFLASQLIHLGGVLSSPHTNCNTIYFYFYSLSSDVAVALFDLHGIELSSGSACSSGAARPSTVMTLSGLSAWSKNGLRLSFGFDYSETEWDAIRIKFSEVFDKIRGSVLVDSK